MTAVRAAGYSSAMTRGELTGEGRREGEGCGGLIHSQ